VKPSTSYTGTVVKAENEISYQGKDIVVFRFIIEYSSLRDFYRPLGNNNK
jgi:hypothetical protein